jgi:hypothetical protein
MAAITLPARIAAMGAGPYRRTASRYPARPMIAPPTAPIRQYQASAAMNAVVSGLTTSADPRATTT